MTEFAPDWISKPSDTLLSLMAKRGLDESDLIDAFDGDRARARGILAGLIPIDERDAQVLSEFIGVPVSFWMKRQNSYAAGILRAVKKIPGDEIDLWLRRLPLRDMREYGWVQQTDRAHAAEMLIAFFGIGGLEEWRKRYTGGAGTAFRTSPSFESSDAALAAWLRRGELQSQTIIVEDWNPTLLRDILPRVRRLSWIKSPMSFVPRLQRLLATAGVALVFARAPSECRASGAARFLSRNRALVQLSFRYRTDDQVWFTLFHELGHLLLHGHDLTFIDDGDGDTNEIEDEANAFASSTIVSGEDRERLFDTPPKPRTLIDLGAHLGVAPGLLVGQLQHQGTVGRNQLNFLKRRYTWEDVTTAFA